MARIFLLVGILAILVFDRAQAVENIPTASYNGTAPADSDIANWDSGWAQPSIEPAGYAYTTGWNYIGTINGNSGVYLGNGWVLTAAHVGTGTFTLGGTNYPMVANSARPIGNSDLILFQIWPCPSLLPLTLRSADPTAFGSQVVMMGYGHADSSRSETWGYNTVTQVNQTITPEGFSYVSNDFLTVTGTSSNGKRSVTNNYQVVTGDSGGGDFIYNSSSKSWELAGINEISGIITYTDGSSQNVSGLVQLDTYAPQINQLMAPAVATDTPTMPQWALILLAGLLFLAASPRATSLHDCRARDCGSF